MFMIGDVNPDMQKLVQVTKECMEIGIAAAQPWKPVSYTHLDVYKRQRRKCGVAGTSIIRDDNRISKEKRNGKKT